MRWLDPHFVNLSAQTIFLLLASESKHHYQYRSIQTEYTSQDVDTQSRLKWWLKNSVNIRDANMIDHCSYTELKQL